MACCYRRSPNARGLFYCGDWREVLWRPPRGRWRLLIAHPTCRWASNSNTTGLETRLLEGTHYDGMRDVVMLECANADRCIIEQPLSNLAKAWRQPDQTVQPYWFGVPWSKAWCLWMRNVAPLQRSKKANPPTAA